MNTNDSTAKGVAMAPNTSETRRKLDLPCALFATLGLLAVIGLAFKPLTPATPADLITLLVLAIASAIAFWTPLARYFDRHPNAATFALTAAMVIVYELARRAGPVDAEHHFFIQFSKLTEDKFVVPYSAFTVLAAALLSSPLWWRTLGGWTRAILSACCLLFVLAIASFKFLSGYFVVGVTEQLDPTYMIQAGFQIVEYGALALTCQAATAVPSVRRWVLRMLPLALLALWLRHQFSPIPVEVEEDE